MSAVLLSLVAEERKRLPVDAAPVHGAPAIAERGARGPSLTTTPWDLSETMTVGEVITCHPAAGPVLERLCINQAFERYDCLDEVAWRHGMESGELLARLEEELARGLTPEGNAQR